MSTTHPEPHGHRIGREWMQRMAAEQAAKVEPPKDRAELRNTYLERSRTETLRREAGERIRREQFYDELREVAGVEDGV